MNELQLSFDAVGFGHDILEKVPHVFKRNKKTQKAQPRTCIADPYGLCALRAQRQLGLRRSYSFGEYASAALAIVALPDDEHFRDFAYCVITAYAVANRYFLTPDEVFGEKRDQVELSGTRHVIQHLAVEIGKCSTVMVGHIFGRHHASVRHAVDNVASLRLASAALEAELDNLENVIIDLWALSGDGEGFRRRIAVIA